MRRAGKGQRGTASIADSFWRAAREDRTDAQTVADERLIARMDVEYGDDDIGSLEDEPVEGGDAAAAAREGWAADDARLQAALEEFRRNHRDGRQVVRARGRCCTPLLARCVARGEGMCLWAVPQGLRGPWSCFVPSGLAPLPRRHHALEEDFYLCVPAADSVKQGSRGTRGLPYNLLVMQGSGSNNSSDPQAHGVLAVDTMCRPAVTPSSRAVQSVVDEVQHGARRLQRPASLLTQTMSYNSPRRCMPEHSPMPCLLTRCDARCAG